MASIIGKKQRLTNQSKLFLDGLHFGIKSSFQWLRHQNMSFEQKKQKTHVKHRDFHSDIQLEVSAGCSK